MYFCGYTLNPQNNVLGVKSSNKENKPFVFIKKTVVHFKRPPPPLAKFSAPPGGRLIG